MDASLEQRIKLIDYAIHCHKKGLGWLYPLDISKEEIREEKGYLEKCGMVDPKEVKAWLKVKNPKGNCPLRATPYCEPAHKNRYDGSVGYGIHEILDSNKKKSKKSI